MLKRTLTGLVFVIVILPIYFLSDTMLLPAAASVFSLIGVYEMLKWYHKNLCKVEYL